MKTKEKIKVGGSSKALAICRNFIQSGASISRIKHGLKFQSINDQNIYNVISDLKYTRFWIWNTTKTKKI